MDQNTQAGLTLYYEALRRIHADWDDSKSLSIAHMALSKALYGLSYTNEIEQLIKTCNREIMNKRFHK